MTRDKFPETFLMEIIAHISSSAVNHNSMLKFERFAEEGSEYLLKDLVYALNIISYLDNNTVIELIEGKELPNGIFQAIAALCLEQVDARDYRFLNGTGSYMLFLRSFGSPDEIAELEDKYLKGLDSFLDEKVYKTLNSPAFELANLIDILLYLPKPDVEFYIYRRSLLEKCMEALLGYWQEISLESQRFTFFGASPESSLRKILPLLHGDLLPAKALMDYATFTGKASFFRSGYTIALNTLLYPVLLDNDLSNTSFYEGSLGIACLYLEFFRMTGDSRFYSAYTDWLKITKENSFQSPLGAMPIRTEVDHLIARTFIE